MPFDALGVGVEPLCRGLLVVPNDDGLDVYLTDQWIAAATKLFAEDLGVSPDDILILEDHRVTPLDLSQTQAVCVFANAPVYDQDDQLISTQEGLREISYHGEEIDGGMRQFPDLTNALIDSQKKFSAIVPVDETLLMLCEVDCERSSIVTNRVSLRQAYGVCELG